MEYRRCACWGARLGPCCSGVAHEPAAQQLGLKTLRTPPQARRVPWEGFKRLACLQPGRLFSSARPGARSGDPWARGPFRAAGGSEHLSFPAPGSPLRGRGSLLPQLSTFRQASQAGHPLLLGILPDLDPYHMRHPASAVRAALRSRQHPLLSLPHPHPGAHDNLPLVPGPPPARPVGAGVRVTLSTPRSEGRRHSCLNVPPNSPCWGVSLLFNRGSWGDLWIFVLPTPSPPWVQKVLPSFLSH